MESLSFFLKLIFIVGIWIHFASSSVGTAPSEAPTYIPSAVPTYTPTAVPSQSPTFRPTGK
jgi:hypothetical protein